MSTDEVEHQDDPYAAVDDEDDDDGLTYVNVAEDDVDDAVELPAESDGKLLLSTLQGQYPNAIGMRYKTKSGGWRGVRISEGSLDPPPGGWGSRTYCITVQKESSKRKTSESTTDEPEVKSSRQENEESEKPKAHEKHLLQDMIVLGIPFQCKDEDLKEYFTKECGEMGLHQVKYDRETKKPRGFGFIRFKTAEAAKNALTREHTIMGKKCEVKLAKKKGEPMNIFIGRIPDGTTPEQLKEHFEQYGDICNAYVPTPFRGFGFVTYTNAIHGHAVLKKDHVMGDRRLNVKYAPSKEEKMEQRRREEMGFNDSRGGPPQVAYFMPPDHRDARSHDSRRGGHPPRDGPPSFNRPGHRDERDARDRPHPHHDPRHDARDARPQHGPQHGPPRFGNRNMIQEMVDQQQQQSTAQLKNILLSVLNSGN